MKPLPASIRKVVEGHPAFDEGWTEQDSFNRDGSWSHWIYLVPGWFNPAHGEGCHIIHEGTARECVEQFKRIKPCVCDDCQSGGLAGSR